MSDVPFLSAALGRAAASTQFATAPPAVRERLLFLVADVLAATVSGSMQQEVARARAAFTLGDGPSSVVSAGTGAEPVTAALLNGMAVAAEQLQDGHRIARGHPASHVVPAVLAAAEAQQATGEDTLSAMLAGYEVGARVGIAMGGTPPGVHDIATWGTIGASAGVAHLVGGGRPDTIGRAVELAASMPVLPDAQTVFGGSTGQHVFLGVGAQLGVIFGTVAAGGLAAPAGTLDRHFGRWAGQSFCNRAGFDTLADEGAWGTYEILAGYVKRHPTCAHLHGANDAVETILSHWDGPADAIESVVIETYAAAAVFDDPAPENELAARFSIPFTVAAALVHRGLATSSALSAALHDPQIAVLARAVEIRHRTDLDATYPEGRPTVVTVHLGDGRSLRAEVGSVRGDGPNALADPSVIAKPGHLLENVVSAGHAHALLTAVWRLPDDGLSPLTTALRDLTDPGTVNPEGVGKHPPGGILRYRISQSEYGPQSG